MTTKVQTNHFLLLFLKGKRVQFCRLFITYNNHQLIKQIH